MNTILNYFVVQAPDRVNRRESRKLLEQMKNLLEILKEEYHLSEGTPSENKLYMEVHHHSSIHRPKKMDPLFLGVSHVVPCCVLWIFGRVSTGA